MQKVGADGIPQPDLSTARRKRRKLALSVVPTSSNEGKDVWLGLVLPVFSTSRSLSR